MRRDYLVSYGLTRVVARFTPAADLGPLPRGRSVVIRTHRGTELGQVVAEAPASSNPSAEVPPVLRLASRDDLDLAHRAQSARPAQFEACRAVFEGGAWPLELIDAEPLLDGRVVLHYLGPHRLDATGIADAFRTRRGLDIVLEPAGRDVAEPEPDTESEPESDTEDHHGCGSCGSASGGGGCGSCGSASGGDGGGCAVKALVGSRRRAGVTAEKSSRNRD